MFARRWSIALIAVLAVTAAAPATGESQLSGLRKRAEDAAKKKAEDEAKKKAEEALKKAAADSAKARAADSSKKAAEQPAAATAADKGGAPTTAAASPPASAKVWENYDFVPGSKVIVYTDFSDDKVGNFSRRLKYSSGALEVVERDGVKMLRSTARSQFLIPVGGKLPNRFTLEIDILSPAKSLAGYDLLAFEGGPTLDRDPQSAEINFQVDGMTIIGGGQTGNNVKLPAAMTAEITGKVAHLRVLMDGPYFKMYVNERRVYNIPELQFVRDTAIRVFVKGGEEEDQATYITSVRLAESEVDVLYDALTAKGRWATQGILFATGKSDLKPESRPVLKEIAATLKEHGDLKILIEGHTDNVGSAASNLTLSDARAAAVKAALVAEFSIDADRITTKGFGDTKPAVPNTTPEGKAQNRRVEIVKQ